MGPNGPRSELIYLVGMGYEDWIDSKFTFMNKGVLVITHGCIGVNEQGLQIRIINQLVGLIGLVN